MIVQPNSCMHEFSYHFLFFILLFLLSSLLSLFSAFSFSFSPPSSAFFSLHVDDSQTSEANCGKHLIQPKPPPPMSSLLYPLRSPKSNPRPSLTMTQWSSPPLHSPSIPSSNIFPNSQTTPAPQTSDNVYSEFHCISELFHTTFPKGIQNCDDIDDVVLDPESAAIIMVEERKQKQLAEVAQRNKYLQRSNELVQVTDLSEEDHCYFREVVQKMWMLYDAIQIILVAEEDKKNPGLGKQEKAEREHREERKQ